jgi:hypothetical protein
VLLLPTLLLLLPLLLLRLLLLLLLLFEAQGVPPLLAPDLINRLCAPLLHQRRRQPPHLDAAAMRPQAPHGRGDLRILEVPASVWVGLGDVK